MLLSNICPCYFVIFAHATFMTFAHATWWYLRALLDFQVCGMPPPIRVPSVEACGTAVWSNFGFWFEPRSEPATFKIRPTHTIVPSLILMFNVQYSLFNVQCSMFCGRSIFNFKDQANAHNRSITCTVPYLIIVIFFSTNKFSRKAWDHTIPPSLTAQNPFFPSVINTNKLNQH